MELIYLWIKSDGKTIKEKGFNFSDHVRVAEHIDQTSYTFSLSEGTNYIPEFFNKVYKNGPASNHADLVNVTGIVGENGAGKTNLLKYIADIMSAKDVSHRAQVVILKDSDKKEIHVYNSIGTNISVVGDINEYTLLPTKNKETYDFGDHLDRNSHLKNEAAHTGCCIYYAPAFDLNEYPLMIDNNNKDYIDVSTNGLIPEDTFYEGVYLPQDEDRIKFFKRANILRQLELSNFFLNKERISNILPVQINIQFDRVRFAPGEFKRNLTINNEEIFNFIDKLIDPAFSRAHGELRKHEGENQRNRDGIQYRRAKVEKIKVEFIYSFLHNFFKNLESDYHSDIGLSLKDFEETTDLLSASTILFNKQNWEGYKGRIPTEKFFNKMIRIIERLYDSPFPINSDDTFVTTNTEDAKEIMNLYYNYLEFLPTDFKASFISVAWRNVSSGENALLDLYSRLAFAISHKVLSKEEKSGKKFKYIYLLIDEGESGFHPQWQKEYLFLLLQFIYYRFADYRVQVFVSSHSPFIVSDLPKNNLIFLHRKSRITEVFEFKEQTLAGNIHSLFADQFFIGDGVKGKFAQEALQYYLEPFIRDQKTIVNPDIRNFIQLIGEPVLKQKLEEIQAERQQNNV